jgi:hypothetical protein
MKRSFRDRWERGFTALCKFIELAQRGVCDPAVLCTMTLKEFGLGDDRFRDN